MSRILVGLGLFLAMVAILGSVDAEDLDSLSLKELRDLKKEVEIRIDFEENYKHPYWLQSDWELENDKNRLMASSYLLGAGIADLAYSPGTQKIIGLGQIGLALLVGRTEYDWGVRKYAMIGSGGMVTLGLFTVVQALVPDFFREQNSLGLALSRGTGVGANLIANKCWRW